RGAEGDRILAKVRLGVAVGDGAADQPTAWINAQAIRQARAAVAADAIPIGGQRRRNGVGDRVPLGVLGSAVVDRRGRVAATVASAPAAVAGAPATVGRGAFAADRAVARTVTGPGRAVAGPACAADRAAGCSCRLSPQGSSNWVARNDRARGCGVIH